MPERTPKDICEEIEEAIERLVALDVEIQRKTFVFDDAKFLLEQTIETRKAEAEQIKAKVSALYHALDSPRQYGA